ncbi:MAG: hypothetical protein NDJ90_09755 [Oligoflexia bacterium]|nr:hypothetical protein [Oligoflexia bacterium]
MSPKAAKQHTEKKAAKGEHKADHKAAPKGEAKAEKEKKGAKAAAEAPAEAPKLNEDGSPVDPDEIEEQEDSAAAAGAGQSSSEAALAAAAGTPTEMSASFKNFRHHPDMENFYRFIYENDLRHEALAIIDTIMVDKKNRRQAKGKSAH